MGQLPPGWCPQFSFIQRESRRVSDAQPQGCCPDRNNICRVLSTVPGPCRGPSSSPISPFLSQLPHRLVNLATAGFIFNMAGSSPSDSICPCSCVRWATIQLYFQWGKATAPCHQVPSRTSRSHYRHLQGLCEGFQSTQSPVTSRRMLKQAQQVSAYRSAHTTCTA